LYAVFTEMPNGVPQEVPGVPDWIDARRFRVRIVAIHV
jgi:hypothetical protein